MNIFQDLKLHTGNSECLYTMWDGIFMRILNYVSNLFLLFGFSLQYLFFIFEWTTISWLMHVMMNAINSDRFHVENWLTYGSTPINTSFKLEPEQQIAMVDAVLQLFTTLLGVRTYLGKKLLWIEIYKPIWKH